MAAGDCIRALPWESKQTNQRTNQWPKADSQEEQVQGKELKLPLRTRPASSYFPFKRLPETDGVYLVSNHKWVFCPRISAVSLQAMLTIASMDKAFCRSVCEEPLCSIFWWRLLQSSCKSKITSQRGQVPWQEHGLVLCLNCYGFERCQSATFLASFPDTARTGGCQCRSPVEPSSPSCRRAREGEDKCPLAATMHRNDVIPLGDSWEQVCLSQLMNEKLAHEILAHGCRSRISTINFLTLPRLFPLICQRSIEASGPYRGSTLLIPAIVET